MPENGELGDEGTIGLDLCEPKKLITSVNDSETRRNKADYGVNCTSASDRFTGCRSLLLVLVLMMVM